MQDYYTILEIERTASARDIKAAYKRLAMLYHPDRNAGDKEAEERFKLINEAYHVLSDPLKKSRYDGGEAVDYETILTQAYWREVKKKRFYQYKQAQQRQYKIDKEYYKIQGLAFLVFIVIAGFCFALIHTIDYYIAVQQEKHWQHNTELIKQVNVQFSAGKFHEAFNMIKVFHDKDPTEFRFNFVRDSLVGELRRLADRSFDSKKFNEAVDFYGTLKQYEKPVRLETLERIASCQYYMGNFGESIQALKHLHNQQPHNLDLVYRIAIINLDNTHNYDEALYYFSLGKKLFKENLSDVYGDAFEIVMDPWDAPDVYYALFIGRAKTNLHLGDYEEALTDANWAVFLRRNQPEGFRLRADAKIAMRQRNGVCSDLQSAKTFGDIEVDQLLQQYCR